MTLKTLLMILTLLASVLVQSQEDDSVPDTEQSTPSESQEPDSEIDNASTQTSSEKNSEVIERYLPDTSEQKIREVIRHLDLYQRTNEVVRFDEGEDSISGLYLPENTGEPQGGVLILHDIEQHANWPFVVAPLREYLPDYGWNTLSLFFDDYIKERLPEIPRTEPSTNDQSEEMSETTGAETTQNSSENETNESATENTVTEDSETGEDQNFVENPDDSEGIGLSDQDELAEIADRLDEIPNTVSTREEIEEAEPEQPREEVFIERMRETVEGGLRQLNTLGQFNLVVIANGKSANWAAEALKTRFAQASNKGYALVLINAQSSAYPDYDLNQSLAELKIPILDIYTYQTPEAKRAARNRKSAIVRNQNDKYIQIPLTVRDDNTFDRHNLITRRVRGWLKTNAAGRTVGVKQKKDNG
ncbi:DUF3530 family protein [Bermanella marisrubri]|uniref:DUF3530 family protein n=1 Tax=Bermanella marisrubri TaxID=207949 RepID=Q1N3W0_9GAMM|nr:DUF3530 family protein [Bermanella marisrubri]EAT12764.1 hypothetical protein RED65_11864 [Oceanobacter sp. RED65] [Bermanella marisrubri]QIZ83093.1 DUF3530 family protein [Bermanella marisrubri]